MLLKDIFINFSFFKNKAKALKKKSFFQIFSHEGFRETQPFFPTQHFLLLLFLFFFSFVKLKRKLFVLFSYIFHKV